jgi:large subunit ribosomal protein L28
MSRICQLTGKKSYVGAQVSHSEHRTKKRFQPNLQTKKIYVPEVKKWVVVKLATSALRTIDKKGAYAFLKEQLAKGFNPDVWIIDPATNDTHEVKRGYRRIEVKDVNGKIQHKITYALDIPARRKQKLSNLFA